MAHNAILISARRIGNLWVIPDFAKSICFFYNSHFSLHLRRDVFDALESDMVLSWVPFLSGSRFGQHHSPPHSARPADAFGAGPGDLRPGALHAVHRDRHGPEPGGLPPGLPDPLGGRLFGPPLGFAVPVVFLGKVDGGFPANSFEATSPRVGSAEAKAEKTTHGIPRKQVPGSETQELGK